MGENIGSDVAAFHLFKYVLLFVVAFTAGYLLGKYTK